MKSIIVFLFAFSVFGNQNLPAPYNDVKEILPYLDHGWFWNIHQLEDIFKNRKIEKIIEVGSWLGSSTIYFANHVSENGKVYAVDHWEGSIEHKECELLPTLYKQFLSNIIHKNLTHKVIPIKMKSFEASFNLNDKADIIYIDAAHDEKNVFQDIYQYFPKLKENGIMCGDDWWWPSVKKAVKKYAKAHNLEVISNKNFWYYKPKK